MVTEIIATATEIIFKLDGPVKGNNVYNHNIYIDGYSPSVGKPVLLGTTPRYIDDDTREIRISRTEFNRDGLFVRYRTGLGGAQYVTKVEATRTPYRFRARSKKGLRVVDIDDAIKLGACHDTIDLPLQDFIRPYPDDLTEPWEYGDTTYYINMQCIRNLDERIKRLNDAGFDLTITLVICNPVDERMRDLITHPNCDIKSRMSAFNVLTDDAVVFLEAAFVFLCDRYTRDDEKYGRIYGIVCGNEISVHSLWCNAGKCNCETYCSEYIVALRMAWLAGAQYCDTWRSYVSLDDHWANIAPIPNFGKYDGAPGKEILETLVQIGKEEGDFYWGIAYHPYTSNLRCSDFWNDPEATDDYETSPVVSFKNLHILQQFVQKPENTYYGKVRRILLSEQGFNCPTEYIQDEIIQCFAYGRAYKQVMQIDEIDAFIYHSHFDNKTEDGQLKLGLWRSDHVTDPNQDAKLLYVLFQAIDRPDNDKCHTYVWQRF